MTITVRLKTGVMYQIQNVIELHYGPVGLHLIRIYNNRFEEYDGMVEKFVDQSTVYMDEILSITVEN